MNNPCKTMFSMLAAGLILQQTAYAGGFSLYTEGSAVEIGNFAAGSAAEGADASIGWYNPAGLVLIHQQEAVFSGVGVFPSTTLTGTSTFITVPFDPYIQSFNHLQGGKNAGVPALHYALPLGERSTFGVSVTSPFGSSTDWGNESPVRYAGTLSKLITVDVSPEFGVKITDNVAIGAGLDLQWAQVQFNSILGSPAHLQQGGQNPFAYDSLSENTGHSFDVGFHAGIMNMFNDNHSRIGLNYQSKMKHQFNGSSLLSGRLADPELVDPDATFQSNALASNWVELPNIVTLSAYQDINKKLALLGSVVFTGWKSTEVTNTQLNQVAAFSDDTYSQVFVNVVSEKHYKNAWRFALGANYHITDKWMLRTGGGYDQTPTTDAERDIRIPDTNRWALAIGGHYQWRPNIGIDLGYSYLWSANPSLINKTDYLGTFTSYNVNAHATAHAQLVGLQAIWIIDQNTKTK